MALFIFTSWGWADTACTGGVSAAPGRGTTNPSFSPRTRCLASVLRLRLPGPGRRGNAGIPPGTLRSQLRASTGEGSTQVDRARGPQQPCDTTPHAAQDAISWVCRYKPSRAFTDYKVSCSQVTMEGPEAEPENRVQGQALALSLSF